MSNKSQTITSLFLKCAMVSIVCLYSCSEEKKNSSYVFDYEVIADSLMLPWNIEVGPDGYLWACEQREKIIRISLDNYAQETVRLEGFNRDTFYMHGLAFHPSFKDSGFVFLSIMYPPPSELSVTGYLDVIKAKYNGGQNTIQFVSTLIDSLHTQNSFLPGVECV